MDIIFILYNLPIDDYVDILYDVVTLYKQGNIDQTILDIFIIQDFNVSCSVAKNYQNEKLQVFLSKLLEDKELIAKVELKNKSFSKAVFGLKSGDHWEDPEDGFKRISKIHPAILDTLKARK